MISNDLFIFLCYKKGRRPIFVTQLLGLDHKWYTSIAQYKNDPHLLGSGTKMILQLNLTVLVVSFVQVGLFLTTIPTWHLTG